MSDLNEVEFVAAYTSGSANQQLGRLKRINDTDLVAGPLPGECPTCCANATTGCDCPTTDDDGAA